MQNPDRRFKNHMANIRRGGGCPALRDAVKKHGEENFKFEVLLTCSNEDRFRIEKEYIQKYNSMVPNGYNICDGGQGSSGFRHTEETKAKISKIVKKAFEDPKRLEQFHENAKVFWGKEENRKAQSDRLKASENVKNGIKNRVRNKDPGFYEESKKKVSESLKKYYSENKNGISDATKKKIADAHCKPIIQYDKEGKIIKKFNSIKEATIELNLPKGGISNVVHGKSKTCGGFIWKFDKTV